MRILVVRLSSLGDVVHALPAVAALRRGFPDARIDWLVEDRYGDLLQLVPVLDHTIPVSRTGWLRSMPRAAGWIRAAGYDVAVDLQGLLKSALLARLSGAARVVGFARAQLREPAAGWLYTEQAAPAPATHVVDKNLALVRHLGAAIGDWEFPLRPPVETLSAETRSLLGLEADKRFVLINPGAAWSSKRWPPERFGVLAARLLVDHGLRSVVAWGPGEEHVADAVVGAASGAAARTPPTSVPDLVTLVAASALVVSGDTGPLHLAAALGIPIVGLYGPSDQRRNGPWHPADVVVSSFDRCRCRAQRSGGEGVVVRRCVQSVACIADITVDHVAEAVAQRLGAAVGR